MGSQTTTSTLHTYASSDTDTVTYIPQRKAHKPKHTETKIKTEFETDDLHDHFDFDTGDDKIIHLGTVEDVTHMYTKKVEL